MKILSFDTSTEACSCALYIDGKIQDRSIIAPRQHATLILTMVDELLSDAGLKPNQLDLLAFGRGPGNFTGLRIACGVAQGIAFGADIPVAPISSLATLAQAAQNKTHVLAVIDARMREIYSGFYLIDNQGIMRCDGDEVVCAPENLNIIPNYGQWFGVGTGWATYGEQLSSLLGERLQNYETDKYPQARAMMPLALATFNDGQIVSAENALPVYLRNKVVN